MSKERHRSGEGQGVSVQRGTATKMGPEPKVTEHRHQRWSWARNCNIYSLNQAASPATV